MKNWIITLFLISVTLSGVAQHYEKQAAFNADRRQKDRDLNQELSVSEQNISFGNSGTLLNNTSRGRGNIPNTNQLVLRCSGLMNVHASSFLAIFNLTQVATTAKEAEELTNKRIQGFIENLKSIGIPESDIYIDMVYLIPVFEFDMTKKLFSKTYTEVPRGFEMQKNIHIKIKKPSLISNVVTLASVNEIYDLVNLEYFVENPIHAYDSLRAEAGKFIKRNTEHLKKMGVRFSEESPLFSENSRVIYPDSRYIDFEPFVSQSLDAARNTTITTVRKPKTVAYSKLSYEDFDIVINPEFTEPVVQYVYTLTMRYTTPEKKKEEEKAAALPTTDNRYFILDKDGQLKTVVSDKGNETRYYTIDANGNLKEVSIK